MDTAQILLVDDDAMLLRALSQAITLRMSMVEVETVASAQEALSRLQEHAYGAVVSDIKMPGMDGFALLKQVQEQHGDTPVLLMTGHNDHQLAIQALRGGAYDYILKPVDRDDFIAALYRALHTHQLRRQIEEQQNELERYALSLEHLVEQRTGELAEANRAQETLLRRLAADLRSPLTSLQNIAREVDQHLHHDGGIERVAGDIAQLKHSICQVEAVVREVEASLKNHAKDHARGFA